MYTDQEECALKRKRPRTKQPLWPCFLPFFSSLALSLIYLFIIGFWLIMGQEAPGKIIHQEKVFEQSGLNHWKTMHHYTIRYTDREGRPQEGVYRSAFPQKDLTVGSDTVILYSPLVPGELERTAPRPSPGPPAAFSLIGTLLSLWVGRKEIGLRRKRYRGRKRREERRRKRAESTAPPQGRKGT